MYTHIYSTLPNNYRNNKYFCYRDIGKGGLRSAKVLFIQMNETNFTVTWVLETIIFCLKYLTIDLWKNKSVNKEKLTRSVFFNYFLSHITFTPAVKLPWYTKMMMMKQHYARNICHFKKNYPGFSMEKFEPDPKIQKSTWNTYSFPK